MRHLADRSFQILPATSAALVAAALATCAGITSAQVPRAAQMVDASSQVFHRTSAASAGDLSVVAYADLQGRDVFVVTSDGSGVGWSAPARVNTTPVIPTVEDWSAHVVGGQAFVAWSSGTRTYFNRFDGTHWVGEQQIDNGDPSGFLVDWHMDVSQGTAGIHIVFAFALTTGVAMDQVYLTSSQDGGATFGTPVPVITTASSRSVLDLALDLDGDEGFVSWSDTRFGLAHLFTQKSVDGGATWAGFAPEKQVTPPGSSWDVVRGCDVHARAGSVAFVWKEDRTVSDQVVAAVSADGGVTLGTGTVVGRAAHLLAPAIALTASGRAVAMWPGWPTMPGTRAATWSGSAWSPAFQVAPTAGASTHLETGAGELVVAEWLSFDAIESVWSGDGGATFSAPLQLGGPPLFVTSSSLAWNEAHANVVASWADRHTIPLPTFPFFADVAMNAFAGGYALCDTAGVQDRTARPNVSSLTATAPVLGADWTAAVTSPPGYGAALLFGYRDPATLPIPAGVVLVDPTSPLIFDLAGTGSPTIAFQHPVLNDPSLCGFTLSVQAVHLGAGLPLLLSNAKDLVVGAL